jgi:hypothetical protein
MILVYDAAMTTTRHPSVRASAALALAFVLSACAHPSTDTPRTPAAATSTPAPNAEALHAAPDNEASCGADHWCVVTGIPKHVTFSAVWGASATDVWVAGEAGTLLHWNGSTWTQVATGTENGLRAITGTSKTDIWAAGLDGTLIHFDGSSWSATQKNGSPWTPLVGPNQRPIYALYAPRPNRVWAGGSGMRYFDGSKWSEPHHGSHLPIMAIWGSDAANGWAVGLQGMVNRLEGDEWVRAGSDEGPNLLGVWGSAPNDVWIVGSSGAILHWNGTTRAAVPSGTTNDLHAVLGFGANDAWAVGDEGTLLHWLGSGWASASSPTPRALLGIWGPSAHDLWVVGEGGVILHRQTPKG